VARSFVNINPESSVNLPSSDGRVSIEIPSGSVRNNVQVSLLAAGISGQRQPSDGSELLFAFELITLDQANRLPIGNFSSPITIGASYSNEDLRKARDDLSRLTLAQFDPTLGDWWPATTIFDTGKKKMFAETLEPGVWGILLTPEATSAESSEGSRIINGESNDRTGLSALNERIRIEFDPAQIESIVQINPLSESARGQQQPPEGTRLALAFEISSFDQQNNTPKPNLESPVVVKVRYSPSDLQFVEGDPTRLALARFDSSVQGWQVQPTTINQTDQELSLETTETGTWGLLAAGPPLPQESGLPGVPLMMWVIAIAVIAAIAIPLFYIIRNRLSDSSWGE
jgi:hypothetical protein